MQPNPDLPQVPSEHAAEILQGNWPGKSESGTAAASADLFLRSAESLKTADVAEASVALIEACATGKTPEALVSDFTADQRAAFDRMVTQLNQGHGASVMAQDILNTKVQLNGTVMSFEASVKSLLSAAAALPNTPQNQAELEKRYQELLDAAKQQANMLGKNHTATQEALLTGIQKGGAPEVPSTMALTSADNPSVPGMPDGALGSALQNVAGQMMKPQNMPIPALMQSVAPLLQSAQSAIGQLVSSLGQGAGAGAGEDALSVLAKDSNAGDQKSTLGDPAAAGAGAAALGAGGAAAGANRPTAASEAGADEKGKTDPSAKSLDKTPTTLAGAEANNATVAGPTVESVATAPSSPAVTSAPALGIPATTLSAGGAVTGSELVSSVSTRTSSGDVAVGAATLSGGGATMAGVGGAAGAPMMPMMPMMPPMMGGGQGAGAGSPGTTTSADRPTLSERDRKLFQPERPEPSSELTDFGSDLRGLAHATDTELVASSILAAIVRTHDRAGLSTAAAVGVSTTAAVFVTRDGLGFLPRGIRAAGHLTPLITKIPASEAGDTFIRRWLGCDQPWRPLLEAAALGLVDPFDTVVTTDEGASAYGVLALTEEQINAVNIAAGSKDRWHFDAVDADDVQPVMDWLGSVWGSSLPPAADLLAEVSRSHWTGNSGPGNYPRRWARYLLAAAAEDVAAGDIDDARYMLRCALRIPEDTKVLSL